MGTRSIVQGVVCCAVAVACLLLAASAQSGDDTCTAPQAWFQPGGPPPPDPNQSFGSFCAFHQWAWQSFLWLTQPDGNALRFMNFATPDRLFAKNPGSFAATRGAVLRLSPSLTNTQDQAPFSAINQANPGTGVVVGTGSGVLVDRNGRVVYYSMHINETFFNFVIDHQLNFYEKYRNADKNLTFPLGALELKAAWRILQPSESGKGLFVTQARVDRLKAGKDAQGKPAILVDTTAPPLDARVTLIGLHVVGVVKDHPEFLWATFEHRDNVPDLMPGTKPSDPVSKSDSKFYTANTPLQNCNQFAPGSAQLIDAEKQTVAPTSNIARLNPWGGPNNQGIIQSLNASVHTQLPKDSILQNYNLVGTVWLKANALEPGKSQANDAVGSTRLANSTMESFQQGQRNCFSCHDTRKRELKNDAGTVLSSLPQSNLNISHAMTQLLLIQGARQAVNEGADPVGNRVGNKIGNKR